MVASTSPWITEVEPRPLARRPRILLLTPSPPWPADSGGSQRTALLLEALRNEGDVDLCLIGSHPPIQAHELAAQHEFLRLPELPNSRGRRIALAILGWIAPELALALPSKERAIQVAGIIEVKAYDVVVIRYSATACQLKDLPCLSKGTRWIVDVDDFMAQMFAFAKGVSFRSLARDTLRSLAGLALIHLERRALLNADGLWITGFRPRWLPTHQQNVVELPNISWNRSGRTGSAPPDGKATDLLGVARFSYAPNLEGFDWFVRRVWPLIRASIPGARLKLVGNPPRGSILNRWAATPGVEVTGKMQDVAEEYASALVAIAPIFRGGGTKIKVLEALEMGLPCVCSAHAASPLSCLDSLQVANDPRTFADHCLKLIADAELRAELAEQGRRQVQQHYSRSIFGRRVSMLLHQVVQKRGSVASSLPDEALDAGNLGRR
jgi:polysaccharide biosynthesis protein PslH